MANDSFSSDVEWFRSAADAELDHVRRLGTHEDLIMATINPGAYEALLAIMAGAELGTPICPDGNPSTKSIVP